MSTLVEVPVERVANLHNKLLKDETTLSEKYRVLFSLRNVKGSEAHDAMIQALKDQSALFRHEVAFCMGQRQEPASIETLKIVLNDTKEHPMVRHEAGEALGAIATEECLQPLREHLEDPVQEVAETCQLALQRVQYFQEHPEATDEQSPYYSVDPTPALPASTPLAELRNTILDESARMFDRYSALFALRNKGGREAVDVLGDVFNCSSALLKHETAYVLGQMLDSSSVEVLTKVLQNQSEHAMVRHEAAEALGAIAQPQCIQLLKDFQSDQEPIVADSCVVALDMLEFEQSGQFSYADMGTDEPCN